tara:strand:- start:609 stop:1193 length:585 start_codon:yes stop_codon:yes gene_type:complete
MSDVTKLAEMRAQNREEEAFLLELQNDPITESELGEMLKSSKGKASKMLPLINELKAEGLIVPDPPLTFDEFKVKNKGKVSLKDVTLAHMTSQEFRRFRKATGFAVFREMGAAGAKPVHYRYVDQSGRTRKTGSGFNVKEVDWVLKKTYSDQEANDIQKQIKVFTRERANIRDLFKRIQLDNPGVELPLDKVIL